MDLDASWDKGYFHRFVDEPGRKARAGYDQVIEARWTGADTPFTGKMRSHVVRTT